MKSRTIHRFVIGQAVRMKKRSSFLRSTAEGYRITAFLPVREDNSPQYRIRNDDELYERVMTEDGLEEITARPVPGDAAPQ